MLNDYKDEFDADFAKAKAWYLTLPVYFGTAIGFGLGLLAAWVF